MAIGVHIAKHKRRGKWKKKEDEGCFDQDDQTIADTYISDRGPSTLVTVSYITFAIRQTRQTKQVG